MRVVIYLELKDLRDIPKIAKAIKQWKPSINYLMHKSHDASYKVRRFKRLKWIKDTIQKDEKVKIGSLYKRMSKKGYTLNYRTFQRDIAELIVNLEIKGKNVIGKMGNTTLISK